MANTIRVPRAHLIMALCLPLAVILGYFLTEPTDLSGFMVIALVLGALAVPCLMKWHHPLLVVVWNSWLTLAFLPGAPDLWMLAAVASLLFAILNRSVNPEKTFLYVPSLAKPLFLFALVIVATALLSGGVGLRVFASRQQGGGTYIRLLIAVAGYFALTSERIPVQRAGLFTALFFLSGITAVMGNLIYAAGPKFSFLFAFFSSSVATGQAGADYGMGLTNPQLVRLSGLAPAGAAVYGYVLMRYGLRGVFDPSKPWRLLLLVLAAAGCMMSGFRTALILLLLTVACLFWLEGLWRTRALPIALGVCLVAVPLVLAYAHHLPLLAQRTLSFLPLPSSVDRRVIEDARASTDWRLQMWDRALEDIPKYLLKGKGYAFSPEELFFAQESSLRGFAPIWETSFSTGNYHNGPLSVIIPLGIFGMGAFLWFLAVTLRFLYRNYRSGPPELHGINTFLLAAFIAKTVFFFFVFGSLHHDFFIFTGLAGLSVSLNGTVLEGANKKKEEETSKALEELEPTSNFRA